MKTLIDEKISDISFKIALIHDYLSERGLEVALNEKRFHDMAIDLSRILPRWDVDDPHFPSRKEWKEISEISGIGAEDAKETSKKLTAFFKLRYYHPEYYHNFFDYSGDTSHTVSVLLGYYYYLKGDIDFE